MDQIATALDRLRATAVRRPEFGRRTIRSVTTLGPALRCTTVEKDWRTESDLSAAFGGEQSASGPGTQLRAALGACMAMGYRLRAAERGVELTSVTVTIEADGDVLGMLEPDAGVPPGYLEIRCHVEIESPAPREVIEAIVDAGDRLSPLLDVIGRANTVRRTSKVVVSGQTVRA